MVKIRENSIRVGYPSRRVGAKVFIAAIIHHLMEGEGKCRVKKAFGYVVPCLWSARSVISNDSDQSLVKSLGVFLVYSQRFYVCPGNRI